MRNNSIRRLAVCGLLAALVMLLTFAIKIPVPATGGYIHPGDGAILYAGLILGPFGAIAAGVGSALADLMGGYAIFALPTLLIKGGMGLLAGLLTRHGAHGRNILTFTLAALFMAGGYFLTECVLFGLPAAIAALIPNLIQGLGGVALGMLLSFLPIPAGMNFTARTNKRHGEEDTAL